MLLTSGSNVDRFVVVRLLGERAGAEAYLVRNRRAGSLHVLTVPLAEGAEIKAHLADERRAQASLRHPNLLPYTGVAEFGGRMGLIRDTVDGLTLAELLAGEDGLPVAEGLHLFEQICLGVSAAHTSGVLHHDLSPHVVLLQEGAAGVRARVFDFGMALVAKNGDFGGTPGYIAPEQLNGDGDVDERADVYSLGCLLHELLGGRADAAGRREAPVNLEPDVPMRLLRVVARALSPDRSLRFATVEALRVEVVEGEEDVEEDTEEVVRPVAAEPAVVEDRRAAPQEAAAAEAPPMESAPVVPPEADRPPPGPGGSGAGLAMLLILLAASGGAAILGYVRLQLNMVQQADAMVAARAERLDGPWRALHPALEGVVQVSVDRLAAPAAAFCGATTARERVETDRALVRAVRGALSQRARTLDPAQFSLASAELESLEASVKEAEGTLARAQATREGWATAVAATVGWLDPSMPAASVPLPPAQELPAFLPAP